MKRIILTVITLFLFLNCKSGETDYDRFKLGVNVSLQNVLNWNSKSRLTDINYHKVGFFTLGIFASERINFFDFSIGATVHEETLDNFSDQFVRQSIYYTLRSSHLSIPLGVDIKLSKKEDRYLFTRFNFIMDYIFNAEKIYGINRATNRDLSFYRNYLEFGVGYNTLIKRNYGFRAVLSFFPIPFRQEPMFDENVTFSKFGICVGAYKSFK